MNGYDIDGVLTKGVIPEEPYVIITGRPYLWAEKTFKELENLGIKHHVVYLNPESVDYYNPKISGAWKAEMINKLKITEFYEDEIIQADIIREVCKDCKLNLVT